MNFQQTVAKLAQLEAERPGRDDLDIAVQGATPFNQVKEDPTQRAAALDPSRRIEPLIHELNRRRAEADEYNRKIEKEQGL
jgi:hypothetical protein